jgi:hypothetical protein
MAKDQLEEDLKCHNDRKMCTKTSTYFQNKFLTSPDLGCAISKSIPTQSKNNIHLGLPQIRLVEVSDT